jgi:5-formyltetrahydrofolate cyclo-ligase
MDKTSLRQKYKVLRLDMPLDQIDELSLQIANQSLKLDIWNLEFYHIFLAIENQKEINTEYILQIIFGKDANVVIPKMDGKDLQHYLLTDTTKLKLNRWKIPEPVSGIKIDPQQLDLVFVPLLGCDTFGNRVGYGKGFYDKFLANCKKDVIKVGLSFFPPDKDILEVEDFDIALDYCITPKAIYTFKNT